MPTAHYDLGMVRLREKTEDAPELSQMFQRTGYLILRGAGPHDLLDAIRDEVSREYLNAPESHWHPDGYSKGRVQDAWKRCPSVAELAQLPRVVETLEKIYGRYPHPFQTLTFSDATQQRAHSDHIHFSSYPLGMMCGVWVAIEDVSLENGPLFYYPGSHMLPYLDYGDLGIRVENPQSEPESYMRYESAIESVVASSGLQRDLFTARKGDVLIWHANLIHGGAKVSGPSASRWSQVTHYYFDDCIHFTPRFSTVNQDLFLRKPINICTGAAIRTLAPKVGSESEPKPIDDDLRLAREEIRDLRETLRAVFSSKSWRWTSWIRRLLD